MTREFKISQKRCLIRSLIRSFLALGGICFFLILLISDKYIEYAQIWTGGFIISFLTLLTNIKNIRVALKEQPVLCITAQGIIENYTGYGFISYSEITDFYFLDNFVIINIADMNRIQRRQSKYWQWFHKTYKDNEPDNITIPGFIFQDDPKEIVNTLRNALNEYQHQTTNNN